MAAASAGTASTKLVYWFEEADHANPMLFGGRGAGLARMTTANLPVAPGSDELLGFFYRAGFRTFAIDAAEIRAADLALGKAALLETTPVPAKQS